MADKKPLLSWLFGGRGQEEPEEPESAPRAEEEQSERAAPRPGSRSRTRSC